MISSTTDDQTTKEFDSRKDAVAASKKWQSYSSQQKPSDSGTTLNIPAVGGVTPGGTLTIGGSTLGQIPATYRQLGGMTGGGLSSSSGVAPSVYS